MNDLSSMLLLVAKNSLHPWRDWTDCCYDDLNRKIRKEFEKELNKPPTPRDEEIKDIITQEKAKWESDKIEFESNPIHWSNNKRKRNGLPVLRGKINKNRLTKFHSFKPTPRIFFAIEDMIDETLPAKLDEHFNQFVDIKDFAFSDALNYNVEK